jgi:hypothetical protein
MRWTVAQNEVLVKKLTVRIVPGALVRRTSTVTALVSQRDVGAEVKETTTIVLIPRIRLNPNTLLMVLRMTSGLQTFMVKRVQKLPQVKHIQ